MEPHDLIPVYSASEAFKADIIKNMLEEEGIRAFVDGETQAVLTGLNTIAVKVLVDDTHAEEARKLIEEHEAVAIADALAATDDSDNEPESESESEIPTPA